MNKIDEEGMSDFSEYTLQNRRKLLYQFDCDVKWVTLMNNRLFTRELAQVVFSEAKKPSSFVLGGMFIYGDRKDDLSGLIDEQTLDIVSPLFSEDVIADQDEQSLFTDVNSFFTHHPPKPKKCNIYFVGDGHTHRAGEEFVSIHWNCIIIDLRKEVDMVLWYDPSDELKQYDSEVYNFSPHKKRAIVDEINRQVFDIKTVYRAQQFCSAHPAQDVFCQSWVFMFASAYINNAFNEFAILDFVKYQTQPLKMWLRCIASVFPKNSDSWYNEIHKKYKRVFTHCRREIEGSEYDAILEELPRTVNLRGRGRKKIPCIYSIITHYLELETVFQPEKVHTQFLV